MMASGTSVVRRSFMIRRTREQKKAEGRTRRLDMRSENLLTPNFLRKNHRARKPVVRNQRLA